MRFWSLFAAGFSLETRNRKKIEEGAKKIMQRKYKERKRERYKERENSGDILREKSADINLRKSSIYAIPSGITDAPRDVTVNFST